ncbi:hypothetical protein E4T39_02288 [Aureobasidium subglaciale]|nr:hypothetical protein E4T39_02288 [Aureobasidium subglaciale]
MAPIRIHLKGPHQEPQVSPVQEGKVHKSQRVVKNKAKALAPSGAQPWNDEQRHKLIDFHAEHETWAKVGQRLGRSSMACRGEFKKLADGEREYLGLSYQGKAQACKAKRGVAFPKKGSTAEITALSTPEGSVIASASTVTIGSTETVEGPNDQAGAALPEPERTTPTTQSRSATVTTSGTRTTRSRDKEDRHDSLPVQSQVNSLSVYSQVTDATGSSNTRPSARTGAGSKQAILARLRGQHPISPGLQNSGWYQEARDKLRAVNVAKASLSHADREGHAKRLKEWRHKTVFPFGTPPQEVESSVRQEMVFLAVGNARQRMGTVLRALELSTSVVAVDRGANDELDTVMYPALFPKPTPYDSTYTFRKEEAWVKIKRGPNRGIRYQHPWGFDRPCGPQRYSEADTVRYNREKAGESSSEPVAGLSDAEVDADLRLMLA